MNEGKRGAAGPIGPIRISGHRAGGPFRFPSLNTSPTCSVDDLAGQETAGDAPTFKLPAVENLAGNSNLNRNLAGNSNQNLAGNSKSSNQTCVGNSTNLNPNLAGDWRQSNQRKPESPPMSYKKTLEQLSALRKQRPMLGSTSDYFSLASSICSEDGDYYQYDYGDYRFETGDEEREGSEYGWPLSEIDREDLKTVLAGKREKEETGEENGIRAALLDNICQQTRELERRNEELRQELEQLHMDTKRFVMKNGNSSGGEGSGGKEKWEEQFQLEFDGDETVI